MSVGQELQQKRAERQLSVEQLAATTKLKVSVIHALENVQVDELPAMVYVIGYLRVLAAELKLDSDDFVERYVAELNVECARAEEARLRAEEERLRAEERRRGEELRRAEETARAEALAQAEVARLAAEVESLRRQLATPVQPVAASNARSARRPWASAVRWPRVAVRWPRVVVPRSLVTNLSSHRKPLFGAALAVLVVFAMTAFHRAERPAGDAAALAASQVQPQPQPDAIRASATPAGPPMRAEIVLTKTAFVSASADGRSIASREMSPGERLNFDAQTRAVLRVSDPSAVTLSIDGQAARPLGTSTRWATFEVTRDAIRNFMDP